MRRESCAWCDGRLADYLDLGSSPLAGVFPASLDEPETWYPLQVAVCEDCRLSQLREVVPDEELFGADYGFRTGASPAAVRYFGDLARSLIQEYPQARELTVEIACNDGTFLKGFAAEGCEALGIESAKGAADDARDRGLDVITEPFSLALARKLDRKAGLLLAFNVAAHVADPLDFLEGVREVTAHDGVAVVEFQDLAALIAGCQFDHVYHEHRFYYSRAVFERMARECGLRVIAWERSPAQGGSARATLRCGPGQVTWPEKDCEYLAMESGYRGMQKRVMFSRQRLRDLVDAELDAGRVIAGWGASAKSATLLNYCDLGPEQVRWMEDLTPGKIGRYTPGGHIPVEAPGGRKPDTYLLTSWNYAGAMLRMEREFLASGGRVIIPGALPVIL